ncbi:hypothetical protein [Micromonospora sp. DH14]|uniref:hypothetical protein n=1 Tax=Micromonospora sp. DH14 TaxID=3040120 RepID=UPI002442A873|nr:hypothetical protein [Micromonospora sp. DH14]MDG9673594.1 hypothetical protein [Micromonospora sp. DH14]
MCGGKREPETNCQQLTGQTVPADVVLSGCPVGEAETDRVTLTRVTVRGRLNLSQQYLKHGLLFHDCHIDDGVDLSWAVCEELIEFVGCELGDLHGDNIIARKGLSVVDCTLRRVTLAKAQITEDLRLSGSTLTHETGALALHGSDMVIEKSLRLDDTRPRGRSGSAGGRCPRSPSGRRDWKTRGEWRCAPTRSM